MADKYKVYGKHYGITPSMAKAIVKIVENEINCNECLDIVTVGERPENVNFAMYFDTDEPAGAVSGDVWVDTDNGSMYIYNGITWTTGFRWDFENGITNDAGNVKLGGELIEDTLISGTVETFTVQRNPTGDDSYVIALNDTGIDKLAAGYVNLANPTTNSKILLALSTVIGLTAADDNTIEYTGISAFGNQATMTYTDVTGGGIDNSSIKASNGLVTLDAPVIFLDGELIQLDGSTDIVMEYLQKLTITSEATSGTDSKSIEIFTGANSSGNTGSITIQPGTATDGNGGDINITSGKSLTSGNGGDIIVEPSTGVTATGNLVINNLPTFAGEAAAAALNPNTVYKTATGELRIKL